MFDWLKRFFLSRVGGCCPQCGSTRVAIKIRRKFPFMKDGATVAFCTCRDCRRTWSFTVRSGI